MFRFRFRFRFTFRLGGFRIGNRAFGCGQVNGKGKGGRVGWELWSWGRGNQIKSTAGVEFRQRKGGRKGGLVGVECYLSSSLEKEAQWQSR